jgi:hypothetical protein
MLAARRWRPASLHAGRLSRRCGPTPRLARAAPHGPGGSDHADLGVARGPTPDAARMAALWRYGAAATPRQRSASAAAVMTMVQITTSPRPLSRWRRSILRLRGVSVVGETVGRGPVRLGWSWFTGADQTSVPTRTPRRNRCRRGVSCVVAGPPPRITRGSPGLVLVSGGLDGLAAGRPGPDPLPRLDSRPVQAELPARADPLNPPIAAAGVNPSHPGFRWLGWLWWHGHGPDLLPVKDPVWCSLHRPGPLCCGT